MLVFREPQLRWSYIGRDILHARSVKRFPRKTVVARSMLSTLPRANHEALSNELVASANECLPAGKSVTPRIACQNPDASVAAPSRSVKLRQDGTQQLGGIA